MADLTFRIWYHLSKHPSSDYYARFGPRASRTCRTATSYSNIQFKFNLNSIFSNVGTPNHLKLLIKGKEGGGQASNMSRNMWGHGVTTFLAHRITRFDPRLRSASQIKIRICIFTCCTVPISTNLLHQPAFHSCNIGIHILHFCRAWNGCLCSFQQEMVVRVEHWESGIPRALCRMFLVRHLPLGHWLVWELEHGGDDLLTILSNAKRTIRKDEARISYAGWRLKHLNSKFNLNCSDWVRVSIASFWAFWSCLQGWIVAYRSDKSGGTTNVALAWCVIDLFHTTGAHLNSKYTSK